MLILPAMFLPSDVAEDDTLDCVAVAGQESGWINELLFKLWVEELFIPEIEIGRRVLGKADDRALLIVDGHASRASPEALDFLALHAIDAVTRKLDACVPASRPAVLRGVPYGAGGYQVADQDDVAPGVPQVDDPPSQHGVSSCRRRPNYSPVMEADWDHSFRPERTTAARRTRSAAPGSRCDADAPGRGPQHQQPGHHPPSQARRAACRKGAPTQRDHTFLRFPLRLNYFYFYYYFNFLFIFFFRRGGINQCWAAPAATEPTPRRQ